MNERNELSARLRSLEAGIIESLQLGKDQEENFVAKCVVLAVALVMFVSSLHAITLEVFVRCQFGQRYLTWTRLLLALFILTSSASSASYLYSARNREKEFLAAFDSPRSEQRPVIHLLPDNLRWRMHPLPLAVFVFLFVGAALFQKGQIALRYYRGTRWHSKSMGLSYPFWDFLFRGYISAATQQRFVEPALLFIFGLLIALVNFPLAGVIISGSTCMFIKATLLERKFQNKVLDAIDGEIEAEAHRAAVEKSKTPKTLFKGYTMFHVHPNNFPKAWNISYAAATAGLDPGLQAVLTPQAPPSPSTHQNVQFVRLHEKPR